MRYLGCMAKDAKKDLAVDGVKKLFRGFGGDTLPAGHSLAPLPTTKQGWIDQGFTFRAPVADDEKGQK